MGIMLEVGGTLCCSLPALHASVQKMDPELQSAMDELRAMRIQNEDRLYKMQNKLIKLQTRVAELEGCVQCWGLSKELRRLHRSLMLQVASRAGIKPPWKLWWQWAVEFTPPQPHSGGTPPQNTTKCLKPEVPPANRTHIMVHPLPPSLLPTSNCLGGPYYFGTPLHSVLLGSHPFFFSNIHTSLKMISATWRSFCLLPPTHPQLLDFRQSVWGRGLIVNQCPATPSGVVGNHCSFASQDAAALITKKAVVHSPMLAHFCATAHIWGLIELDLGLDTG